MEFYQHNSFDRVTTIDGKPAMQCKCGKTYLAASKRPKDIIAAHKKHAPELTVPTKDERTIVLRQKGTGKRVTIKVSELEKAGK